MEVLRLVMQTAVRGEFVKVEEMEDGGEGIRCFRYGFGFFCREALGNLLRWAMGNRKDISSLRCCNSCCICMGWENHKGWKGILN